MLFAELWQQLKTSDNIWDFEDATTGKGGGRSGKT